MAVAACARDKFMSNTGTHGPTENGMSEQQIQEEKRAANLKKKEARSNKAIKTCVIVLGAFYVCWLPIIILIAIQVNDFP